jgi:K(+)-stimulated pyrophosphate-energized sodium pump
MNLVALLITPAIISMTLGSGANAGLRTAIALGAVVIIVGAMINTKRKSTQIG